MRSKRNLRRLTLNIDARLIDALDIYSHSMGINRTSALSILLSNQLDSLGYLDTSAILDNADDTPSNPL